jgi:hypothetical protein
MNLHSLLRPPPLYLYMLGLFTLSALPGLAADGVLEIGQTCAVQTGCHAGDAPGFPVTIDQPGSFVLTSDLRVADANLDALQIQSDDVSIDLNGFTIVGPVDCTGLGSEVSCQHSPCGRVGSAASRAMASERARAVGSKGSCSRPTGGAG